MAKEMMPRPLPVKARLHLAHEENASLRTRIAALEAESERLRKALGMMLKEHDILSGNYDVACPVTGVMPPRNPDRWPTAAEAARALLDKEKLG